MPDPQHREEYMSMDTPAPPVNVPGSGPLMARFKTSEGDIEVELFENDAPRTVANFVALARGDVEWRRPNGQTTSEPLYSGTVFHRVIPEFMIQGGCPQSTGTGGPGWKFRDEPNSRRHDTPGVLSMANAGPNTNGSQFFITEVPTPHLDGKHTVFGKVKKGLELVPKIARMGNAKVRLEQVEIYRG
jgi:peptidyl-prolyl cis-trans isomerase A (cyclophilin A)